MSTTKRGPGRPSVYDEEQVTEILVRLAEGESLRSICAGTDQNGKDMPSKGAFLSWVVDDTPTGIADRYAGARMVRFEGFCDDAMDVAKGKEGSTGVWQRDRLVVDTMKFFASRLLPAYKGKLEHSGQVGITIDQLLADTDEEAG